MRAGEFARAELGPAILVESDRWGDLLARSGSAYHDPDAGVDQQLVGVVAEPALYPRQVSTTPTRVAAAADGDS